MGHGGGKWERGCTHAMHGRIRVAIDPRTPKIPGRSTSGFRTHLLPAFSHLTIDHESLSGRSTVATPNIDTFNVWVLNCTFPFITHQFASDGGSTHVVHGRSRMATGGGASLPLGGVKQCSRLIETSKHQQRRI